LIIDTHTHLLGPGHWPQEWWDWVAEDWAKQKEGREPSMVRDRIEDGLIDPDGTRMVERMNHAGVDMSVLLAIDWGPDFTGTRPITTVVDHMLDLATSHQNRFVPFGGIDPRRPEALELVAEWFERGVLGLKLYPGCGWDPRLDAAMEIYALAEKHKKPVLFHTGHPLPILDTELSNPLALKDVVLSFPDLPVWLGHAGAPIWWKEALEVAEAGSKVRLEMSVWLWDDSDTDAEIDFTRKVIQAGQAVGLDRVIFGTDHVSGSKVRPAGFLGAIYDMYLRLPHHAKELGSSITEQDMANIMGGTAARDLWQ
jgi:predicted TIM-barrel fold metal-dependent hydrolase